MALLGRPSRVIRHLRVRARLSQQALAKKADISQRTLSDYENGKSSPPVEVYERILAACGVASLGELQRELDVVSGMSEPHEPYFSPDDVARAFPASPADLHRRLADLYEELETVSRRLRETKPPEPKE